MLHHFFGTIYLTLFALHLHTYLFEKASKHSSLIKHFPHRQITDSSGLDCALYIHYSLYTSWLRTLVY